MLLVGSPVTRANVVWDASQGFFFLPFQSSHTRIKLPSSLCVIAMDVDSGFYTQ